MTESTTDTQAAALAAAIPGLEAALRDAAARAMKPDMPLLLRLGFFQVVVGYVRTIRQYRKAAGLPSVWPTELTLLLGSVRLFAQPYIYDSALTERQALRVFRIVNALAQSVLTTLPPLEKTKKTSPKPVAQTKTPPVVPRMPAVRTVPGTAGALTMDPAAMLDASIGEAVRAASGVRAMEPAVL